jgi:hypothetical protein
MNETPKHAVLLAERGARDPLVLAKALAAARKTPVQDQVVLAKSCWGILTDHATTEEAHALKQALEAAGVKTVVCPATSLLALPAAEAVNALTALPAAKPILFAAAGVTITSSTTKKVKEGPSATDKIISAGIMLTTGLPIRIGGKTRVVEKTEHHSDLLFYIDVLYGSPLKRMRVDAQNFDYSFLKARKLYQVLGNFKLLVEDLTKMAPEAWQNHGSQVLLAGKPMITMGYETLADLERETLWLLTLQGLH